MNNSIVYCTTKKPTPVADRTLRCLVSDETLTRGTMIVKQDGWDLERYMKNPVILWDHQDDMVIGNAVKIWVDETKKALMADIRFLPKGMYDRADLLFELYSSGFMKGISAGFKYKQEDVDYPKGNESYITYKKQQLLEISMVSVPANQNTLVTNKYVDDSIESGLVTQEQVDVLLSWIPNMIGDDTIITNTVVDLECEIEALKLQLKEETMEEEDDVYKMIWSSYVGYDNYKKENIYDDIVKEYIE